MKIGIVLSQAPAYSETFFNSKIKGLLESGYQVVLFVQSQQPKNNQVCLVVTAPVWHKNRLKQAGTIVWVTVKLLKNVKRVFTFIRLERQARKPWNQVLKNLFTNSHLLASKLDWLHFGFTTLAIESEHVAQTIGAKMAVSLRGFDIDVYPLKHPDCYKGLWKQVDKVHGVSDYILERAYQLGLSKNVLVQKITPAIDTNNFHGATEKAFKKNIQMITVARLHWIKGLMETLEALSILKNKGLNFKYTLIGTGKLYESLKFAIHQLQLTNHVELVGNIPHTEVASYLMQGDIYIQYSHSEGFCNAVLEAQAAGLLCVVSNGGGLPENVIDKETGWVVPKRQPESLAQKLMEVIQLPPHEKEAIRQQARLRIEKYFSLEQQKRAFKKFYEDVS